MLQTHQTQRYIFHHMLLSALHVILLIVAITLLIEHRIGTERLIQLFYLLLILAIVNLTFFSRWRLMQQEERLDAEWRAKRFLEGQERYRSLSELLPQTVFEVESNGNFLYSNQQGFKVTGYTQEDIAKGLNIFQLLVPEDHEKARRNLGTLSREGGIQCNLYTLQRKDGSRFPVQIHSAPITQDHRIVGVRGIAIDITERRHTEEELQRHREHLQELVEERTAEIIQVNRNLQQEMMKRLKAQEALRVSDERYRLIVENQNELIVKFDPDFHLSYVSPRYCELVEAGEHELLGEPFFPYIHEDDLPHVLQSLQELFAAPYKCYHEERVRTKDGWRWLAWSEKALLDQQGTVREVVAVGRDVTERKQTEEALKESEQRFRRAILYAPFPIMIHAEDGEVILLSHVWSELSGYSSEELPSMSAWLSKAYGKHVGKVQQEIRNLYGIDRRIYEGEFEIHTASGLTRIWDFSSAPLGKLADGRRAVISVGVDITGRKLVEKTLREKESAIASSINGIAIANLEGALTYINTAFLTLWDYDHEEEVLGRSALDFWYDPEKAAVVIEALRHEGVWFGELTAKKKNNSTGIFQLSANLIRNEQGHPISMMASFIDVTEHRRAEEALIENEKKLNDALNMGRMGFWEYHVDSQTINWSEQVFTLYERDPTLGPPSVEEEQRYYLPGQAELLAQYARKAIEDGTEARYDTQAKLPGGRLAEFSSSMHAVKDARGKVVKLFGTVQDITERKQIEEQLKTSLQEKEVLLKEVHHRVKNNLQVIASMLYLQSKTLQDGETRALFLDSRNRIKSMALVHESLYQTENLARIDIADYIRRLVVNIFRSYRGSSLGIIPTVKVDNMTLSTEAAIPCGLIINELVSNALKYAFPDRQGEVWVDMTKDTREHVVLQIRDDGVGFPTDFEDRQRSSLGIKLVRSLVDQLDGTIEICSDHGSTFRIKFTEPTYRKRI